MRERRQAGYQRAALVGVALLTAIVLVALLAPLFVGASAFTPDLAGRLRPPGPRHLLGQDALGRDVLARLTLGARLSLGVGLATVLVSAGLGILLGAAAGYRGGWLDELLGRVIDVLLAFPGLLLAIALAAVRGPSLGNVVLALSVLGWTGYARLARSEVAGLGGATSSAPRDALGAARRASSSATCCPSPRRRSWCRRPSASPGRSSPRRACPSSGSARRRRCRRGARC